MEFVDVGTELFGIDLDEDVNSQKEETVEETTEEKEETVENPPEDLVSKPLPYQFEPAARLTSTQTSQDVSSREAGGEMDCDAEPPRVGNIEW